MNEKARTISILEASNLDATISGYPSFKLANLEIAPEESIHFSTPHRLGHLIEKIVSALIKSSRNYQVVYENIQLFEQQRTIGEIDFILMNKVSNAFFHVELAYKFYLYDPTIDGPSVQKWIGPNRNDSMLGKLTKLRQRQFPLLYHQAALSILKDIDLAALQQQLCFLVTLFVPYQCKETIPRAYQIAIKGYYLNIEQLYRLHQVSDTYCLPQKKEWGIAPSKNKTWETLDKIKTQLSSAIKDKKSLLCWKKNKTGYESIFVVWWL